MNNTFTILVPFWYSFEDIKNWDCFPFSHLNCGGSFSIKYEMEEYALEPKVFEKIWESFCAWQSW